MKIFTLALQPAVILMIANCIVSVQGDAHHQSLRQKLKTALAFSTNYIHPDSANAIREELNLLDPEHKLLYSEYIDPHTGQFREEVKNDHNRLNRLWFALQDTNLDSQLDGYELLMAMSDGLVAEHAVPLKEAIEHVDHIMAEDDRNGDGKISFGEYFASEAVHQAEKH